MQAAWSFGKSIAQQSMSDQLGVARFEDGRKAFVVELVPRFVPYESQDHDGHFTLTHMDSIVSMFVAEVLDESLDAGMEGLGMLSTTGRTRISDTAVTWMKEMQSTYFLVDQILTMRAVKVLKDVGWQLLECPLTPLGDEGDDTQETTVTTTLAEFIEEEPMRELEVTRML